MDLERITTPRGTVQNLKSRQELVAHIFKLQVGGCLFLAVLCCGGWVASKQPPRCKERAGWLGAVATAQAGGTADVATVLRPPPPPPLDLWPLLHLFPAPFRPGPADCCRFLVFADDD